MYSVSCRQLGFADCDFVAEDRSPHKVIDKVMDHARDEHPGLIAGLDFEQREELLRRIKSQMIQTAA